MALMPALITRRIATSPLAPTSEAAPDPALPVRVAGGAFDD